MKYLNLLALSAAVSATQFFPQSRDGQIPLEIVPFALGDDIQMDCIARNIDNGEHKFDEQERITYVPFPTCKETGKPLLFRYGVSEDVNCTIAFSDELYHLFQLYIHEDVPFNCRLPLSNTLNHLEKGGAYVPLVFNFRGEIHESHLDVDPALNVLITKPNGNKVEENSVISAVAYSSSTNATRIVIGDSLTLNLAVRWFNQFKATGSATNGNHSGLPYADGFYKFPLEMVPISYSQFTLALVLVAIASSAFTYGSVKFIKPKHRYGVLDNEAAFGKQD